MKKSLPHPKLHSPGLRHIVGLVLLATWSWTGAPATAAIPSDTYSQLRLLVEALYEIDNKYVSEKKERDLIYGAIRGLVASLDSNSSFLTPAEYQETQQGSKAAEADAGLELAIKDNLLTVIAPTEGGPAWRAGIRADDHILKINNQSVRNVTTLEAARKFQGPPGTKVKVQLIRTGLAKPLDLELTLERPAPDTMAHYLLEDGFYFIRLRSLRERSAQELQQVLRTIQASSSVRKGIILDLRNTAGGQLEDARRFASAFVGNEQIYAIKGRHSDNRQSVSGLKDYRVLKEKLPLVVLVDQGTARAAEVIAGALQAQYGASLMGYKTFGDCAVTKLFPLKDGSAIMVSVGYCYTPRDQLIQGKGLEPDSSGPKKDVEDQPVSEPSDKLEKARKLPEINEIMQDPLVLQALARLKNWGKSSVQRNSEGRPLRKKQAAGSSSNPEEISYRYEPTHRLRG